MIIGETGQANQSSEGLTALIYGLPGVGKTVFASQFPNPFYIDIEGGAASIKRKIPKVFVENHNDIMELQAAITGIKDKAFTLRGQRFENIETLIIDTIDELNRMEMRVALQTARKETPKWDEWNLSIERTRIVLYTFKNFAKTKGLNVVFISHEEYEKNDLTSMVTGQPNLSGSLPQEVAGWMDLVLHMTVKQMGTETKRLFVTQPESIFLGRDRTWALQRYEDADFPAFWKKVQDSRKGGKVDAVKTQSSTPPPIGPVGSQQ